MATIHYLFVFPVGTKAKNVKYYYVSEHRLKSTATKKGRMLATRYTKNTRKKYTYKVKTMKNMTW